MLKSIENRLDTLLGVSASQEDFMSQTVTWDDTEYFFSGLQTWCNKTSLEPDVKSSIQVQFSFMKRYPSEKEYIIKIGKREIHILSGSNKGAQTTFTPKTVLDPDDAQTTFTPKTVLDPNDAQTTFTPKTVLDLKEIFQNIFPGLKSYAEELLGKCFP